MSFFSLIIPVDHFVLLISLSSQHRALASLLPISPSTLLPLRYGILCPALKTDHKFQEFQERAENALFQNFPLTPISHVGQRLRFSPRPWRYSKCCKCKCKCN